MTTKLLLFLAFASYALYANARDIPRASVDFEDTSYEDAKNDKEGTYAIKNDGKFHILSTVNSVRRLTYSSREVF